jgi:hypothetical protein
MIACSPSGIVPGASLASLPVFALLVSGFSTFTSDHAPVTLRQK